MKSRLFYIFFFIFKNNKSHFLEVFQSFRMVYRLLELVISLLSYDKKIGSSTESAIVGVLHYY